MGDANPTQVTTLGERTVRSPLTLSTVVGDGIGNFTPDGARVRFRVAVNTGRDNPDIEFERAGPREHTFFDPAKARAAMVTCGGLCPGINNVIRSLVLELHHNYGVGEILGLRYGFRGLDPAVAHAPTLLTPGYVDEIHEQGGTVLGSSRGQRDVPTMVGFLADRGIDMLFCIGGDGTHRGAHAIAQEVLRLGLKIAVVGIPKTIDNDIPYVRRTFGFGTAVDEARTVLDCAHTEAKGAWNGIGLVKLMGRDAGFIAAGATLASQEVNFTLVPEIPLKLNGKKGFLNVLKERIVDRGHAVIVVAEGAGQDLIDKGEIKYDASGNKKQKDIGPFLKKKIGDYFAKQKVPVSIKYIDPSYIIRSVPANAEDSFLCDQYARHAVHAAMAGKTDMLVGYWNSQFMHVPISMAVAEPRSIPVEGDFWNAVIAATGQPRVWE